MTKLQLNQKKFQKQDKGGNMLKTYVLSLKVDVKAKDLERAIELLKKKLRPNQKVKFEEPEYLGAIKE